MNGNKQPINTKPKGRDTGAVMARAQALLASAQKSSSRKVTASTPQPSKAPPINSKNVMNTVHNVTVASPTLQRKDISEELESLSSPLEADLEEPQQKNRIRTKTRTIDPAQSVMQKLLQQKNDNETKADVDVQLAKPTEISEPIARKSPIAFEISLDLEENTSENEYDDDFESYESDFESEPESAEENAKSEESEEIEGKLEEEEAEPEQELLEAAVIRDEEKKLDSGNYDLPPSKDLSIMDEIEELVTEKEIAAVSGILRQNDEDKINENNNIEEGFDMWPQNPIKFNNHSDEDGSLLNDSIRVDTEISNNTQSQVPVSLETTAVDSDGLNESLINSSCTISRIMDKKPKDGQKSDLEYFSECFIMRRKCKGKQTKVKSTYAFDCFIIIILTIDDGNLLEVYDFGDLDTPKCVLLSRHEITSVIVLSKYSDTILGGTLDGSISVWNWKENEGIVKGLEEKDAKLPPSGNFVPEFLSDFKEYCTLVKLIELSPDESEYAIPGEDLATLYSPGFIVIWSVVRKEQTVKLMEVKVIHLERANIKNQISKGMKSSFEMNVTYFENNIFSDAALKELQTVKTAVDQQHNLSFSNLCFDGEFLIGISNQNFITITSLGLENETKKIILIELRDESAVRITAAAIYKRGVIIMGYSDGTVKLQSYLAEEMKEEERVANEIEESNNNLDNKSYDFFTQKSCAIQNIVLAERMQQIPNVLDVDKEEKVKVVKSGSYEVDKILNRTIIQGSYFRRSFIKDIAVYDMQEKSLIYFVNKNRINVYDMVTGKLSNGASDSKDVRGICVCKSFKGEDLFVVEHTRKMVKVHLRGT